MSEWLLRNRGRSESDMQNGIEIGDFDSLDEISNDFKVWADVQFSLVVSRNNAENKLRQRQGVENFEQYVGPLRVPFNTSLTFCQKVNDVYICIESRKVSISVSGDGVSSTDYAVIKGFCYTEFTSTNGPRNSSINVGISQGGGTPLPMGCLSQCDGRGDMQKFSSWNGVGAVWFAQRD